MFGFLRVRPPLKTSHQLDIELLMRRSVEVVGATFIRELDIVTDLAQLPLDSSNPSRLLDSAAREVQRRMPPLATPCRLEVAKATDLAYPSTYTAATAESEAVIKVADETLLDSLRAVMELAYQYSNHFWHRVPNHNALDTEPRTTNLLPICCGLGVLASDACLYDQQWSQAGWSGWSMSRSGYYTAAEIGYALALLARTRDEADPEWMRSLRLDSKVAMQKAQRYFAHHEKAGGSLLFDAAHIPSTSCDMRELATWFRGQDRAMALAAGLALVQMHELSPLVIEAAIEATHSPDQDLVPVAARLLGRGRRNTPEAEARVRELIRRGSAAVSLAAVQAADEAAMPLSEFGNRISQLLDQLDGNATVLLQIIGRQGKSVSFLAPRVCYHLGQAVRRLDDESARELIECLQYIVDDPRRSIEASIKSPAVRQQILERFATAP